MQRASSITDSLLKQLTNFVETKVIDEINKLRTYLILSTDKTTQKTELDIFTTPHSKALLENTESCLKSFISLFSAYAKNKKLDNSANRMQSFLDFISLSKDLKLTTRSTIYSQVLDNIIGELHAEAETFPGKEKILEYLATINVTLIAGKDTHKLIPLEGLATDNSEARKSIEKFEHATFGK